MTILVAGTGDFGTDVSALLARQADDRQVVDADSLAGAMSDGVDAAVLTLFRPSRQRCDALDERSAALGIPWLPVVLENAYLRVGPWIVPGAGSCFRCYYRRRQQHDEHAATTEVLHAAYDRDPGVGPRGHLPHHARLAAGVAGRVLRDGLGAVPDLAGAVYTIQVATGQIIRRHVVAVDGCPRCAVPVTSDPLGELLASVLSSGGSHVD
jgi:bacteriocin biosynthesis cyclodehydratase domain-containing protein